MQLFSENTSMADYMLLYVIYKVPEQNRKTFSKFLFLNEQSILNHKHLLHFCYFKKMFFSILWVYV